MSKSSRAGKITQLQDLTDQAEEAHARTRWKLREQMDGAGSGYRAALREERRVAARAAALYRELSGEDHS